MSKRNLWSFSYVLRSRERAAVNLPNVGKSLKQLFALGVASVLLVGTPAVAANAQLAAQVRMASGIGFSTFDPVMATPPTVDYLRPVYDTLVVRRGIDTFAPGLATAWKYSEENTVLTLTLREDVRFTDGSAFDAEAVKVNLERGKAASGSPWSAFYRLIEKVEVPSKYEVVLHLTEPNPTLPEYFSTNPGMMVSAKALQEGVDLAFNPIGSGGWMLDTSRSVRGDRYTYAFNKNYWDPAAQPVDTVSIRQITDSAARVNALRSGQVDIAAIVQAQGAALEELGFTVMPTAKVFYLMGIWDSQGTVIPALKDPLVRRAIRLAINRKAVLKVIFADRGTAGLNFYPAGVPGHSAALDSLQSYSVKEAKELMKQAGYASGFDVDTVVQTNNARLAEAVSGELAKIGVRMNVIIMPDVGSFHSAIHQKKSPIGIFAHQPALPQGLYGALMSPTGRYNPFQIENKSLDEIMSQAAQSSDAEAAKLYDQVFAAMVDEKAVFFPIVHAEILAAMRSGIKAGDPTFTDAGLPNPRNLVFIDN